LKDDFWQLADEHRIYLPAQAGNQDTANIERNPKYFRSAGNDGTILHLKEIGGFLSSNKALMTATASESQRKEQSASA
jgi:hypothetical protein